MVRACEKGGDIYRTENAENETTWRRRRRRSKRRFLDTINLSKFTEASWVSSVKIHIHISTVKIATVILLGSCVLGLAL